MSAICGNAIKVANEVVDPAATPWPYTIFWSEPGMTVSTTVAGYWTGSCNASGFIMSAQPNAALGITTLSFSFAEASPGTITAPVEDADGNSYTMTLVLYPS